MNATLIFVVAPAVQLPDSTTSRVELAEAQAFGPRTGFALRIFSRGDQHPSLEPLPVDGRLTGKQRRGSDGTQLICDAVVARVQPQQHWLGVYRSDGDHPENLQCLDRVALSELSNTTCWFYPTHDGTYLSWERGIGLCLQPGSIAENPTELNEIPYDRSRIAVLWSLLGDDASLTCVGLTYGGQRIDWPFRSLMPEPMATWARFRVDSQADTSPLVEDCLTVFAMPAAEL